MYASVYVYVCAGGGVGGGASLFWFWRVLLCSPATVSLREIHSCPNNVSCVSGGNELPDAARTKRNSVHYSIILFTVLFWGVFVICRVTAL